MTSNSVGHLAACFGGGVAVRWPATQLATWQADPGVSMSAIG